MRNVRSKACSLAVLVVASCGSAEEAKGPYPYSPAFVDLHHQLWVFPFDAGAYTVPLPFTLSYVAYPADARSLYGVGAPMEQRPRGLLQIEFNPVRVAPVRGTSELGMFSVAVPLERDEILVSGRYGEACGVFEIAPQSGRVRMVTQNSTCEYAKSWLRLSLSPDGRRAVGYRKPRLELIDLGSGTVRSLGEGFVAGAWSPDGKWLAVVEGDRKNRTILLDADSLAPRRALGASNVQWSPDSRYLLGERTGLCPPYWATFVAVDAQTGKERTVSSSRCKVNLSTAGWVSDGIRP